MSAKDRPLVWLHGEVKTPPFGRTGRIEAGFLLRRLQRGELPSLPHARPMPVIERRCYELRITDMNRNWRILFRLDEDAIVILEVFNKTTAQTPKWVIESAKRRLRAYDNA